MLSKFTLGRVGEGIWLTESGAVWLSASTNFTDVLSTSFADVRVCGWLTKSSAEWLTKSNAELAQSRTTSDFVGRQLPAPEPQDAPGNLVGAPGKYVEGRSLVVVGGRRATLPHERAKHQ